MTIESESGVAHWRCRFLPRASDPKVGSVFRSERCARRLIISSRHGRARPGHPDAVKHCAEGSAPLSSPAAAGREGDSRLGATLWIPFPSVALRPGMTPRHFPRRDHRHKAGNAVRVVSTSPHNALGIYPTPSSRRASIWSRALTTASKVRRIEAWRAL
jgi:hypothetical protein